MPLSAEAENRPAWWETRRKWFSISAGLAFTVSVTLYELLSPGWAGDHIGLTPPSLILYGLTGLLWIGAANLVYSLVKTVSSRSRATPENAFNRRAFGAVMMFGVGFPPAWLSGAVFLAWLGR
jgi:hypothetical protein